MSRPFSSTPRYRGAPRKLLLSRWVSSLSVKTEELLRGRRTVSPTRTMPRARLPPERGTSPERAVRLELNTQQIHRQLLSIETIFYGRQNTGRPPNVTTVEDPSSVARPSTSVSPVRNTATRASHETETVACFIR